MKKKCNFLFWYAPSLQSHFLSHFFPNYHETPIFAYTYILIGIFCLQALEPA